MFAATANLDQLLEQFVTPILAQANQFNQNQSPRRCPMMNKNSNPKSNANPNQPDFPAPKITDHRFQLSLPVPTQLDPSTDVQVKLDAEKRQLSISGRREWASPDGQRYQVCTFEHRCAVPENLIQEELKCRVNESNGNLAIEAPLKPKEAPKPKVVEIPIQIVGRKNHNNNNSSSDNEDSNLTESNEVRVEEPKDPNVKIVDLD